jgi:hypothetical protein
MVGRNDPPYEPHSRSRAAPYAISGIYKSAPSFTPLGQSAVAVLVRVRKRSVSGSCWFWPPKTYFFQPPKVGQASGTGISAP